MRTLLFALLLLHSGSAWAQQTVKICIPNSSGGCTPVSPSNPIPAIIIGP